MEAERPREPLLSFAEAMRAVAEHAPLVAPEQRGLVDAIGGILAEPVVAAIDYPAFDMSAMDGFALAAAATLGASTDRPVTLAIGAPAHAGAYPRDGAGAIPISTGAPVPPGCDTVLVRERAAVVGDALSLAAPVPGGLNIRRRGEDALRGEVVASAGVPVTPSLIAALACYDVREVAVRMPPTIALLGTGDELARHAPEGAAVVDSNAPMLRALAQAGRVPLRHAGCVGDDRQAINRALDALIARDRPRVVVTTGGVSAGTRDFVPEALAERGARIVFRGVRMRPGKPVLFAVLPGGELFFGLPGNPVAAFLGFRFLVLAAIRASIGAPPEKGRPVVVDPALGHEGATVFLKVRDSAAGLEVLPGQQSHRVRPLVEANAWLVIDRTDADASGELFPVDPAPVRLAD